MKIKNRYFDTYESNNFPLDPRVGGIRFAQKYVKEYKTDMKTYYKIRSRMIFGMLGTFAIGVYIVTLVIDISGYLAGVVIGATLMTGLLITPELIIRHFIKKGAITPPPRPK